MKKVFALTTVSHQNWATSPILMEDKRVSQMSILNMFPMTNSIGVPTTLLSSITVRSSSHSWVRKWKVTWSGEGKRHRDVTHAFSSDAVITTYIKYTPRSSNVLTGEGKKRLSFKERRAIYSLHHRVLAACSVGPDLPSFLWLGSKWSGKRP